MIHQYKLNGYNIVLDVFSGSVHIVDEVAYDVIAMYEEYFQKPLSHRSHQLLHTDHDAWEMPAAPRNAARG